MFTIKALFPGGHAVYECASYRFRKKGVNIADTIADKDHPSLDMFNADGGLIHSFVLTDTAYAMNSLGKTVDTFHGSPTASPD